ncbi:glycosyltransferase [Neolewinella agarilytica]|uniref:glycosyltransferase n=1 Tax=Neolewinella agarilytica TaxID=478744 RepID=UPI002355D391|nr:glycosyltransferase [Neolewinella agarilytica]
MKVALIGTAHPFRGGLASYNERLIREFVDQGHEADLFTFTLQYPNILFPGKTQYSEEPPPKGIRIIPLVNSINPFNWWSVGNQICKADYDLVLVKFWLPFMGPCFGTILRRVRRNPKTTVISIIDNIIPHESRPGDRVFAKYFVGPVQGFIAMSQAVMNDLKGFVGNKPSVYSPHPLFDNFGQSVDRSAALEKLGLDPANQYLLFFGLIRDYKGLDLLLEAYADQRFRSRNIKLIVAGEFYADRTPYDALIEKHGLAEDILLADHFIQDSDVATYFSACDLLVQPYKTATQSGVTQIAFHFEKPMIVTDVGGLAEMCPDGKVGYVVPPEPSAIAEAIFRYFDATDRDAMARMIREEKKKYGWEIMVNKLLALRQQLKTEQNK